jgi:hypothetical protein
VKQDALAVMKFIRIRWMEAGLGVDRANCGVIKTAASEITTEFPCSFCAQVVRFPLDNFDLLRPASSEFLLLIPFCDFV